MKKVKAPHGTLVAANTISSVVEIAKEATKFAANEKQRMHEVEVLETSFEQAAQKAKMASNYRAQVETGSEQEKNMVTETFCKILLGGHNVYS